MGSAFSCRALYKLCEKYEIQKAKIGSCTTTQFLFQSFIISSSGVAVSLCLCEGIFLNYFFLVNILQIKNCMDGV